MAIFPLIFCVQPLVLVFTLPASASRQLAHEHVLLYLLGHPGAGAGLHRRATRWSASVSRAPSSRCSPRRSAVRSSCSARRWRPCLPSLAVAYVVFALFLVLRRALRATGRRLGADPGPDLLAQVLFTPLLAGVVDLDRHRDLAPDRATSASRSSSALLASLPSVFAGGARRVQRHPAVARPRRLPRCRCLLVLDGLGWRHRLALVRPGAPRHRARIDSDLYDAERPSHPVARGPMARAGDRRPDGR